MRSFEGFEFQISRENAQFQDPGTAALGDVISGILVLRGKSTSSGPSEAFWGETEVGALNHRPLDSECHLSVCHVLWNQCKQL